MCSKLKQHTTKLTTQEINPKKNQTVAFYHLPGLENPNRPCCPIMGYPRDGLGQEGRRNALLIDFLLLAKILFILFFFLKRRQIFSWPVCRVKIIEISKKIITKTKEVINNNTHCKKNYCAKDSRLTRDNIKKKLEIQYQFWRVRTLAFTRY